MTWAELQHTATLADILPTDHLIDVRQYPQRPEIPEGAQWHRWEVPGGDDVQTKHWVVLLRLFLHEERP